MAIVNVTDVNNKSNFAFSFIIIADFDNIIYNYTRK